jgi:cold shock CspA family protein
MADRAVAFTERTGAIATFDDHEGAGTVTDPASGDAWWFHCTRIADGGRTIAVGTQVTYRVEPGPTGLEAVDIAPAASPSAAP